jgi:hypothetical protein
MQEAYGDYSPLERVLKLFKIDNELNSITFKNWQFEAWKKAMKIFSPIQPKLRIPCRLVPHVTVGTKHLGVG